MFSVVVLVSGRGSNLQALIDFARNHASIKISAVISNRPEAYALKRAQAENIKTHTIDHTQYASRALFDEALMHYIDTIKPDLIILAGFMRILTPGFVQHFLGRMVNIHPALLPKFPGLNTHQRALDAKEQAHGASVHFVSEDVDGGPVFLQGLVPVMDTDDAETLAARVLDIEHLIFPQSLALLAQNRIRYKDGHALLDGKILETPLIYSSDSSNL